MELFFLISVCVAFFGILLWIFRPKSKRIYEDYGKIPLKDDDRESL